MQRIGQVFLNVLLRVIGLPSWRQHLLAKAKIGERPMAQMPGTGQTFGFHQAGDVDRRLLRAGKHQSANRELAVGLQANLLRRLLAAD